MSNSLYFIGLCLLIGAISITVGSELETALYKNEVPSRASGFTCSLVPEKDRIDCNPDEPVNRETCHKRGCCWSPAKTSSNSSLGVPSCFFPSNYLGYMVKHISQSKYFITISLERVRPSGFYQDVKNVKVLIWLLNDHTVRVKLTDSDSRRFEVPIPKLSIEKGEAKNRLYDVKVTYGGKVIITRKSTRARVFALDLQKLIYSDQFLQVTSRLPSKAIYGLAENKAPFRKVADTWSRYSLFNRDQQPLEGWNLYGSHPFYMTIEDEAGNSNGVFLFNSNGMDVILSPAPAITYRVIGGVLDFFVFLGPSPGDVAQQYINLIGKPMLPPMWGLGFQICKFHWDSLNKTKTVWKRTRDAGIPFDVQWNDMDYMKGWKDFTLNEETFGGLQEFLEQVHAAGMHYVIMTDPGLSAAEPHGSYLPFDEGMKMNVFIRKENGDLMLGKVWTGNDTAWPDFTAPQTSLWWTKQIKKFHETVKFDGLWIDMNEPSNFLNGDKHGCPDSRFEKPQYTPGGRSLSDKTLCMTTKQHFGMHYNVHSLFGLSEAIATNKALRATRGKRPFIISRSTFPGQGHYSGHWDGDIDSSWDHMIWTIGSIMEMNFMGIPLAGADICGFNKDTTVELCARWSALGAFYPFSRNHNADYTKDQDPAALGPVVVSSAKKALEMRYSLLPYLYTLFGQAAMFGGTVVRPLFFEYPKDKMARQVDKAFLWGPSVYIVPVVTEGAKSVDGYLPARKWLKYSTDPKEFEVFKSTGQHVTLETPLDSINVLIRHGSVIPTLPPKVTTTETRKGNFTLLIVLDDDQTAIGQLYHDDGDSLDTIEYGFFTIVDFVVKEGVLESKPVYVGYDGSIPLEKVLIVGLSNVPSNVTVNDSKVNFKPLVIKNDESMKAIEVFDLHFDLKKPLTAKWA